MFGYGGRLLFVDLTTAVTQIEPLDEAFARHYLGGNGFAAKLLYDRLRSGIDPFDPGNLIVFAVGPITDTTVVGNSRACVASKSPLTGLFFDSTFGGRFPATMKRTGFDAIAVSGRADRPVYLLVDEAGASIKPAEHLWGMTTIEAVQAIQAAEGPEADAVAIGPAGEHLVRYAAIAHYWKNREGLSGRGGMGAVMGSKRLKALAVRGSRKTEVADAVGLKTLLAESHQPLKTGTAALTGYGTPFLVNATNTIGALGTLNERTEVCEGAYEISAERFKEVYFKKDTTCLKCSVACGKTYQVQEGEFAGTVAKMPEFETIFALGTMTGNLHAASLIKLNEMCDYLGMDTITLGVTFAFVCEAIEAGLISEAEVGMPLRFGDYRAMVELTRRTAYREGFGSLLAEGSARIADRLGPEAQHFLYCSRRLELPGHSARALKGMSIGYATGTRGGSHHDTRPTMQYGKEFDRKGVDGKPRYAIRSQHFTAVDDSLVLCRFTSERGFGMMLNDAYARMIGTITGWNLTVSDVERIGERICNLERAFNIREGLSRKDDTLPYRVLHEPIPSGPSRGMYCPPAELNAMLDEYYRLRGWSRDGIPTAEKLRELDLVFAIPAT